MKKKEFTLLLFILLIGGFLRFWWIKEFPQGLYPDEAMNGSNIEEALATGHFKVFYPENNGREGLFINIQALSVWFFGNVPWALRIVSACFGTLTILGIYLLAKELFSDENREKERLRSLSFAEIIALLSAFFIATNFWHLNFSRIGFRAMTVPFFSTFGLYFLFRGLRKGTISDLVLGGIFTGLGFHTYIAFRFIPFIIAVPILWYLWIWWKNKKHQTGAKLKHCAPCAVLLYLFATFIVALPIGLYFLHNPGDFVGRSGQVSIFSAESPMKEFAKSFALTMGMYFVHGDCNWRHNYNCEPELHPLVAIAFFAGLVTALTYVIKALRKKPKKESEPARLRMVSFFLLFWFLMMTFPATLTREGLPHALRSIGTIPPVMILSGFGAISLYHVFIGWLEHKKKRFSIHSKQISRIQSELSFFLAIIFLVIPFTTYYVYFFHWAPNPNAYYAFAADLAHMGSYLNNLPPDVKKYVIVNMGGTDVRGIPMPAQTVMFLTDTFRDEGKLIHNFTYLLPDTISKDYFKNIPQNEKVIIAFLDGTDNKLINSIESQNPQLKSWAPEDFVTLKNY